MHRTMFVHCTCVRNAQQSVHAQTHAHNRWQCETLCAVPAKKRLVCFEWDKLIERPTERDRRCFSSDSGSSPKMLIHDFLDTLLEFSIASRLTVHRALHVYNNSYRQRSSAIMKPVNPSSQKVDRPYSVENCRLSGWLSIFGSSNNPCAVRIFHRTEWNEKHNVFA